MTTYLHLQRRKPSIIIAVRYDNETVFCVVFSTKKSQQNLTDHTPELSTN